MNVVLFCYRWNLGKFFSKLSFFAVLKAMCLIEIAIINMHYVCTTFHRAYLKWRRT